MIWTHYFSVFFDSLAALIGLAMGALYLTRRELMPYHRQALGRTWQELDPPLQVVLLALFWMSGAGFLVTAVAMGIFLLYPYRSGIPWTGNQIALVGLLGSLPAVLSAIQVKRKTLGKPPLTLAGAVVGLIILGWVFSLF